MTFDALRTLCLAFPGATEEMPFGPDALVFKVGGKLFALTNLARLPQTVAWKGAPEANLELRARHEVRGAYHLNKVHWNEAELRGALPDDALRDQLATSYALVAAGLPKAVRDGLGAENPPEV